MADQLPYLPRMGLCYDGQAAAVSVEEGTLSRWASSFRICRGWFFCHNGQAAPVSVKNKMRKKNISKITLKTTTVEFSMAPVSVED